MCPPTAIAGAVIGVFGQLATYKAQKAQAEGHNAQVEAQRKAYEHAKESAGKSLTDQVSLENERLDQVHDQAVDKTLQLRRESLQAKGTALASSESGGLSEEMLLQDLDKQRATFSENIALNIKHEGEQSYWNKEGMRADAQSRVNSNMPTAQYQSSSGAGLGLASGLAGIGVGMWSDYHITKRGDIATAPKK